MKTMLTLKNGDTIGNCIYIRETEPIIVPKTEVSKRIRVRRKAIFRCKCGNEFEALIDLVQRKNTNSCGCLVLKHMEKMREKIKTHNQTHHPLYSVWMGMIRRCEESTSVSYHLYGARGITVCKEWHDINNFIEDMHPSYQKGLQLDREKNNEGYSKANCRWVTRKVNCNNRRNNRKIEIKGEVKNLNEWASQLGISSYAVLNRLRNWDIDRVLTTKKS